MKQKNLLSYVIAFILVSLITSCEETEKDTFGNLYGIVTDSKKDEPVRAASVTLNPIGMKTTTGNDGRFEYDKLEPGQYDVQVIKDGYQTYKSTVTIQAGVTTKMDIPLTEGSGTLSVDPTYLDFGSNDNIMAINISNTGKGILTWEIIKDHDWISKIDPGSGMLEMNKETSVTITVDRTNLDPLKKHTGKILVSSDGGTREILVSINGEKGSNEVVVLSGLYAYYTFDDGTADDQTKKGYDGSFINNPELITDTPNGDGKAVYFRALGEQYINIPYNPFKQKSKYSISFWLKDPSEGMIFSGIGEGKRERSNFPRLVFKDSKFHFAAGYMPANYTIPVFSTTNQIQDGKWHHITIVVEATDTQVSPEKWARSLYIDGKLIDMQEHTSDTYTNSVCSKIQIGGDGDGIENTWAANFKIDNIRFYDRVLSREEILTIYNSEK